MPSMADPSVPDPEMAARLKQAREAAGYETATAAAVAKGYVYSTYAGHENGKRGFHDDAQKYAQAYGVSLDWLLNGDGAMEYKPRNRLAARAHALIESMPPEALPEAIEFLEFKSHRHRR